MARESAGEIAADLKERSGPSSHTPVRGGLAAEDSTEGGVTTATAVKGSTQDDILELELIGDTNSASGSDASTRASSAMASPSDTTSSDGAAAASAADASGADGTPAGIARPAGRRVWARLRVCRGSFMQL